MPFGVHYQVMLHDEKIMINWFSRNGAQGYAPFSLKVTPGFQNAKKHKLFEECCGYACMNWYKEWYMKQTDTGIEQNVNDEEVIATYYYNIAGVKVNKPKKGIYVVKQLLKGGKTRSYKVCY